jgi:hypothetical protein
VDIKSLSESLHIKNTVFWECLLGGKEEEVLALENVSKLFPKYQREDMRQVLLFES